MRVGSLVYATDQGLGILAKSFVDNGVVTDVMVVRHGRHPEHDEWYPGAARIGNFEAQTAEVHNFMSEMDAMLFFETPFRWSYMDWCQRNGVKTALMPMHECLHQDVWRHPPDMFICPSELDLRLFDKDYGDNPGHAVFIPVPVDVPWRQRTRAEVFVHNAGHGGLKGRNGTGELLEACRSLKSDARVVIRSQKPLPDVPLFVPGIDERVRFCASTIPYSELWADGGEGDVFVFPEKFNGLSLPLQEARASGTLVMCGDRFPMNVWLPREPLIPVAGYHRERIGPPYQEYDCAEFDPKTIAAKIDEWHGKDISEYSLQGKAWAEQMSWAKLKPVYVTALEGLVG